VIKFSYKKQGNEIFKGNAKRYFINYLKPENLENKMFLE